MLIKRNNNYYINITAYKNKLNTETNQILSFDLGIKNQLTLSSGLQLKYSIEKTKKEKRIQRILSKKVKGSNNYRKLKVKLNKEHDKTKNRRTDTRNKIVHYLTSNYNIIITQNDSISGWQRIFGKRIESTDIGGIIEALKHKASTLILLNRFIPTTKECSKCHSKYDIKLSERIYKCSKCGLISDRDYNSTLNDIYYGTKTQKFKKLKVPVEYREFKPDRDNASTLKGFNISPYVSASFVSETGSLNALA